MFHLVCLIDNLKQKSFVGVKTEKGWEETSSASRQDRVNYKVLITLNALWYRMHITNKAEMEEMGLNAKTGS